METGVGLIVLLAALYFIPWLIALMRGHHNAGAIFVLNLFLGWSLLGWVAALVWAMTSVRKWPAVRCEPERGPERSWGVNCTDRPSHGFLIFAVAILLGLYFLLGWPVHSHAGPIGHAPYRGNAASGMMNRGPEAGYFNRAQPPYAITPSPRNGGYYQRPFDDTTVAEPPPPVEPPAAVVAPPPPPRALGPRQGHLATHNGSLVEVITLPEGYVDIRYVRPRPEIQVTAGVLLIRGRWVGDPQTLAAIAFVFPGFPCQPVPYRVRGSVDQFDTLVLWGPAPIVSGCQVVGMEWTRNSELRFLKVQ